MTQISGSAKWYTVASTLKDELVSGMTNSFDRKGVVPGEIPWDECDCGMLAVSVGQVYLTDDFPEPVTTVIGSGCNAAWEGGEIVFQAIRCAPSPEGQALAPTEAALDTAAQILAADAYEMLTLVTAKLCQMKAADQIIEFVAGTVDPKGPEGGCVGAELRVLVCLVRG